MLKKLELKIILNYFGTICLQLKVVSEKIIVKNPNKKIVNLYFE